MLFHTIFIIAANIQGLAVLENAEIDRVMPEDSGIIDVVVRAVDIVGLHFSSVAQFLVHSFQYSRTQLEKSLLFSTTHVGDGISNHEAGRLPWNLQRCSWTIVRAVSADHSSCSVPVTCMPYMASVVSDDSPAHATGSVPPTDVENSAGNLIWVSAPHDASSVPDTFVKAKFSTARDVSLYQLLSSVPLTTEPRL